MKRSKLLRDDVATACVGFSCGIMVSMALLNYTGGVLADYQPKLMVSATSDVEQGKLGYWGNIRKH